MKKFELAVPYVGYKYIKIEAEDAEKAIQKAFDDDLIDCSLSLCWQCSREVDEILCDDEHIIAKEVTE